jgi:hypothetical protein
MVTVRNKTTLEELGKSAAVDVEVEIELDVLLGEPMVRYYPDGSGYPGHPTAVEIVACDVTEITGAGYSFRRSERPEYFELLDEVILRIVQETLDADDLLADTP